MARLIPCHWEPRFDGPGSRRGREGCDYQAYLPDRLVGREFTISGEAASEIARAEAALARFDIEAAALTNSEALARLLLRAEAVASSRIEGLVVGPRRLLRAEAVRDAGASITDITASEILNNIDAMDWAVSKGVEAPVMDLNHLLEIHRRILTGTSREMYAGKLREVQNWIGRSGHNPCNATYVPPPPEHVESLLMDLTEFCNQNDLPAVAQAAIAHAQFETIHPFIDGNGRAGRALIHTVLRRRGLSIRASAPISLVLATHADQYVAGLASYRYIGPARSRAGTTGVNAWLAFFAWACRRAVSSAEAFESQVAGLIDGWFGRLGPVRHDSAADRLIRSLPALPVLTVQAASDQTARSFQATNEAVARLERAGILHPVSVGRRNRAFEAAELVDMFATFERALASPAGDTSVEPPSRPVPPRIHRT